MTDATTEVFVTLCGCDEDEEIDVALAYDTATDEYTFVRAEAFDEQWETLDAFEETGWSWGDIESAISKQIGMRNPLYIGR